MRLGDLDELKNEFEWLESVVCECQKDSVRDSIQRVENATTIDPETLPIVQELRKELERVTAEREAAVSDLEFTKICSHCKNCNSLILPIPKVCQECTHGSKWEWRGIQEVKNDE